MPSEDGRTAKRKVGDLGENIACQFLMRRGFEIIERNYLKKWGEIDIVARKGNIIHFVEVKSVSRDTSKWGSSMLKIPDNYRPEDNMHPWKLKRLARTMQTYLLEKRLDLDWQLDVVTVRLDHKTRQARVEIIENIVI